MQNTLSEEINQKGYIVIENFLTEEETEELYNAGKDLCIRAPKENCKIFSTINGQNSHSKEMYFLESGDKVHYFFEEDAFNDNNELIVSPLFALNKVGHALHTQNPLFKNITFSNRVKEICWQLNFIKPAICQSMYIYKNPKIGGEVTPHQDSWFLYTEPNSTIGFWIALEDSTTQNGCLQFIEGSHRSGVHRRYLRNTDNNSTELMIYNTSAPVYPQSTFTAVPVKKGSCVIIHGNVVHKSESNRSQKSRHAYTFHVIETENVEYSTDNWLQLPHGMTFPILFHKKT